MIMMLMIDNGQSDSPINFLIYKENVNTSRQLEDTSDRFCIDIVAKDTGHRVF